MLHAEVEKDDPDSGVITGLARVLVQKGLASPPRPVRPMPEVVQVNIDPSVLAQIEAECPDP